VKGAIAEMNLTVTVKFVGPWLNKSRTVATGNQLRGAIDDEISIQHDHLMKSFCAVCRKTFYFGQGMPESVETLLDINLKLVAGLMSGASELILEVSAWQKNNSMK